MPTASQRLRGRSRHAASDRVHGAALFADVSGFTVVTKALAQELGPRRGAEELTFISIASSRR